jgi:hypothetical protein
MNPARSFAPAIWNGSFAAHWIYWLAPLSAAIVNSYFYKYVFWRDTSSAKQVNGKLDELEILNQGKNDA